jgi:hypothetical protein
MNAKPSERERQSFFTQVKAEIEGLYSFVREGSLSVATPDHYLLLYMPRASRQNDCPYPSSGRHRWRIRIDAGCWIG